MAEHRIKAGDPMTGTRIPNHDIVIIEVDREWDFDTLARWVDAVIRSRFTAPGGVIRITGVTASCRQERQVKALEDIAGALVEQNRARAAR